jgi:hypothetical protein
MEEVGNMGLQDLSCIMTIICLFYFLLFSAGVNWLSLSASFHPLNILFPRFSRLLNQIYMLKKYAYCLAALFTTTIVYSQNVGIGTTTPATRLDVAGTNGWDLINGEGDMRIGNGAYRLKFGVALAGGGAGGAGIMQSGGLNQLSIGSNNVFQLQINGADNSVNISNNALLKFPAGLSKKIILYPGAAGDAHLGVFANELRISSDYSGADITFGYDNRTTGFTEKFRMKANGGLAVNGSVGNDKQVLSSNGGSSSWKTLGSLIQTYTKTPLGLTNYEGATSPNNQVLVLSALTTTVTVTTKSQLIISAAVHGTTAGCLGCGDRWDQIDIRIDGADVSGGPYFGVVDLVVGNGSDGSATISNFMRDVNPGTHTIEFIAKGSSDIGVYSKYATVIVLPID